MKKNPSRRSFIKKATLGSAAITSAPFILSASKGEKILMERHYAQHRYSANDQINLGLIGTGIQGIFDTKAALKTNGVKLVAACDLYTGRLDRAKELWGNDVFVTRDYRQLLERKDVDAVIVATPDHWHKKITIDAMNAGKHVYCEKPMVQKFAEGHEIISAHKKAGKICQVGSNGMSSLGNEKAKMLYKDGAIGELILFDFNSDRYSSEGAWQYPIPPDASPDTVDFDTFLGNAPKVPYDPTRFFRWRNYQDYGTGVPGDMFVHAFSTLHYIIDSTGPTRAMATGGLRYWKDGRDVPDIAMGLYDYEKTETHPAFNASMRVNFIDGAGGGHSFRLVGTEGAMEVGESYVKLTRAKIGEGPGGYSMISFPEATQEKIRSAYAKKETENRKTLLNLGETVFEAPEGYQGSHYDHTHNFIQAVRGKYSVIQDPSFGLRAAGAALLANESYFQKKVVNWDPVAMKMV